MLKISEVESNLQGALLKLEGKISGDSVAEMQRICHSVLEGATSLRLDLAEVTFADRGGVKALAELRSRGVEMVNCSVFLTEQLKALRSE
jgi:ABC-type transporter Mla MlaB component